MMYDQHNYQDEVLKILGRPPLRDMCNLRMELFMAAALSTSPDACLMPFPACFFDAKTKTKNCAYLQEQIGTIPRLAEITDESKLEFCTWELLYWIFTNPLEIRKVPTSQPTLNDWTSQTGLNFDNVYLESIYGDDLERTLLYTVAHTNPKMAFVNGKKKYGTKFAFHGSPLKNFHSIIHRGLVSALNKRSSYGSGSYLSSQFEVSSRYSTGTITAQATDTAQAKQSWVNSSFRNASQVRCVAICEIVMDPSIFVRAEGSQSMYVVKNDELIQLSHIIMLIQ